MPGLKKAFLTIFKPSLFIPQINVRSINDIDFKDMKNNGINCIIFDKDNTLSYTYIDELHPSFINKMIEVKGIFPEAVAILSNSVGTSIYVYMYI
jgi:predicted HAD superfamily phosphohydrolase YqeG